MTTDASVVSVADQLRASQERVCELEARLEESEETLEAIRRGDFDAVVVEKPGDGRQVYTLENADRPYRVLIEQIQEGAFTLSPDGAVLYCNPRLAEMLGIRQERLMGLSLAAFVVEDDRDALKRMVGEAMRGVARGEICFRAAEGTPVAMYLSLSPLHQDEVASILCGVLTDLTRQKLHVRELADANARLQTESLERTRVEDVLRQAQKMEAVGQLTGGIAHDFNNLLTIIRSSTDLLRRRDLSEDRQRRYVDAISDTVDRAARLTKQLLAFARRQVLKPEVFDVGESVRLTSEMLGSLVGARIRIVQTIPSEPHLVEADTSQFETALVNLAVNARDAMDGEGTITLTVDAAGGGSASLVSVSLTDTGMGIAEADLAHIFEPFFTTKEVGKGTGLGLSQVFGFAKQSGGNVEVASTLGHGTTFILTLPRAQADASMPKQRPRPPLAQAHAAGGGRRVLVVEDNVEVGTFSTQLLQDLGYETTWATNAEDALVMLAGSEGGFDVVFSDVVMPGMNGVDLGRQIHRLYPTLPVVLTSGYSHVLAQESHHGFELLQKPYAVEELSRLLKKFIRFSDVG